jgi:hypothetical protein
VGSFARRTSRGMSIHVLISLQSTMACIVRPIATRRRTCVSSAVTGFRCESGALCSSSQPKVPKQLLSRASPLLMTGLHGMCTLGPQPDTEEEGSALDFPEVSGVKIFLDHVLYIFPQTQFCTGICPRYSE